jgi:hypothetical protein
VPRGRSRRVRAAALVAAIVAATGAHAAPGSRGGLELHVAPNGRDDRPGTESRPLASLEGAREALRAADRSGRSVTIWLHAGDHELERTFVLEARDSGSPGAPIVVRPRPGAAVRLVGGRVLPPGAFAAVREPSVLERLDPAARDRVLRADLGALGIRDHGDPVAEGKRPELFFADEPMTLARWPNEGFARIAETVEGEPFTAHGIRGDRAGRFLYEGDRPSRWIAEIDHARLHGYWFWDWSDSYEKVASIDVEEGSIALSPPFHRYGYRKGQPFYALNLLAELDAPGEWFLDRPSGHLYFWPPAPIDGARIVFSVLSGPLVELREASHVRICGITFEATRGTGIVIDGGRENLVEGCVVRNTGAGGIEVRGGRGHGVRDCDLHHLGSFGVALSGGDRPSLEPAGHFAVGNHVHDFGRLRRTYAGAFHLDGVGNRIANNLVHDAPHLAVLFRGNEHVMEWNEIRDVCRETGDVGVFYTGRDWTSRGNVIRWNLIRRVRGPGLHGAQGIYLDDAASGTIVFGNVIVDTFRAMLLGGGRDNRVENNLIVDCDESIRIDNRGLNWMKGHVGPGGVMRDRLEAMPYREEPWASRYPQLRRLLEDEPGCPKGNVVRDNVVCRSGKPSFAPEVVEFGTIEGNWTTDEAVRFVDSDRGDYRLAEGAAWRERVPGFRPIPFDRIGLRRGEEPPAKAPDDSAREDGVRRLSPRRR